MVEGCHGNRLGNFSKGEDHKKKKNTFKGKLGRMTRCQGNRGRPRFPWKLSLTFRVNRQSCCQWIRWSPRCQSFPDSGCHTQGRLLRACGGAGWSGALFELLKNCNARQAGNEILAAPPSGTGAPSQAAASGPWGGFWNRQMFGALGSLSESR